MTPTSVRDIRNLSLLGQSGSGKTTLLEKLLATAGAIGAPGSVEKGDTVSDFDPQEKTFGHSLNTALAHLDGQGCTTRAQSVRRDLLAAPDEGLARSLADRPQRPGRLWSPSLTGAGLTR